MESSKRFELVTKKEWNGRIGGHKHKRQELITTIRFVFDTETLPCSTKEECISRVFELQDRHIEFLKLPDINYNFLIGGDGNVYEGRGFIYKITKLSHHLASYIVKHLTIGYIGQYKDMKIPRIMEDTAHAFIEESVKNNYIEKVVMERPEKIRFSRYL